MLKVGKLYRFKPPVNKKNFPNLSINTVPHYIHSYCDNVISFNSDYFLVLTDYQPNDRTYKECIYHYILIDGVCRWWFLASSVLNNWIEMGIVSEVK